MGAKNSHPDHQDAVRTALDAVPISELVATFSKNDPDYAKRVRESMEATAPILAELAEMGYQVDTLAQLRQLGKSWRPVLPVLQKWMLLIENIDVKEEIIRCLSVPWVGNKITGQLIELFKQAPHGSSLGWAIGNALSIVDVKGFENQIIELCFDRSYGISRQMLVLSLAKFQDARAENTALELIEDEDVRLHAIIALGKMRSRKALAKLEHLLNDKKSVIRKEARKAIKKIGTD